MAENAAAFFLRFNTAENQKRRMTAQIFRTYPSTASPRICQSDNKKSSKSFSDLLLVCRCDGRRLFSFQTIWLTVKPEFKLAFYEFCLDVVLHIHIKIPVDVGAVADKSGVMGKHLIHSCRVALMHLYNRFV